MVDDDMADDDGADDDMGDDEGAEFEMADSAIEEKSGKASKMEAGE